MVDASSREGVALVLVLGFLSLLLILAVAFASTMRVERMATRNYSDLVAARNLTDMSLTRALVDYDSRVGNSMDLHPAGPVVVSAGNQPVEDLLDGALQYIPRFHHAAASTAESAVRWSALSTKNGVGGVDPLKFRIAYMVVDTSGFLDVNHVGLVTPRAEGTNTFEIAADANALPGLEIKSKADLQNARTSHVRFETLAEFYELGKRDAIFTSPAFPINFVTYSHFPAGYWEGGSLPVRAPVPVTGAYNRQAVETKLGPSGLGFPNAYQISLLMEDFLDPDFTQHPSLPLNTFSSESLPMINEMYVTNVISVSATTNSEGQYSWTNSVTMSVELWYPFLYPENNQSYDVGMAFAADTSFAPALNPSVDQATLSAPWSGTTRFQVATVTKEAVELSSTFPEFPNSFNIGAVVFNTGEAVFQDQAITTRPVNWGRVLADRPRNPGAITRAEVGWQADDPRLNWDLSGTSAPGQWTFDSFGAESLGLMNDTVTYADTGAGADGDWAMYAASRASRELASVGEFGYLLHDIDKPWQTIRFCSPDPAQTARVLDGFTLNRSTKGYVNANSANRNALAAVFVNAPIEVGPEVPGAPPVTDANAYALADRIIAGRPYTNRSEIATALVDTDFVPSTNSLMREAVIRNSIDLLHTRQNLVTIVAAAQVLSQAPDNSIQVVAEQRAVAQVWRDPFPNADGLHPTFTRFFKWLD